MNCTPEQLTYERFGEGRHLFKGCGQQQERYLEPWFTSEAAANRFSKELKCDIKTTTEERIDADTHVVEGCGQRITYVRVCNGGCKWIANLGTTTK